MATPGTPQNFQVQTGNQQVLVSWSLSTGATFYTVARSQDNITFNTVATVSGSPLATSYLDSAVSLGTQYWYTTTASNFVTALALDTSLAYYSDGISWILLPFPTNIAGITAYATFAAFPLATNFTGLGISSQTLSQSAVPAAAGETSLLAIRLAAKQRADRVNSQFVTDPEWNNYINTSMYELYDLLITTYEDYFLAPPIQFVANGNQFLYPLPDGKLPFLNPITMVTAPAQAFYKLQGVDLALQNATNAYVTINKFNFIDRNRFVYPNTASTIYGVFNPQYRVMGSNIEFIPTPSASQNIRLWYIPRLTTLLQDTDTTAMSISGWTEYVVVKAAYYALTKEESDTSSLVMQLQALTDRIISTATNRDVGQPDTISDTRVGNGGWGSNGNGTGFNGGSGGY